MKNIIQNYSRESVKASLYSEGFSYCIQIESIDGYEFLELEDVFKKTLKLRFDDIEWTDDRIERQITTSQAEQIKSFLEDANKEQVSVLVYCTVGKSRSGAIVQYAIDSLGFESLNNDRQPNRVILKKLKVC